MGRDFATGPPQDAIPREAAFSEELRVVKSALERIDLIGAALSTFPSSHFSGLSQQILAVVTWV